MIRTVAKELCTNAWRIVIEPKICWAVRMDQAIEAPVQPVSVDAASNVSGQLDQLQVALDELVDEQKKNYIEWEAKLAKMSDAERALAYGKNTGKGAYDGIIGGIIDMEKKWLSFMWKAIKYPLRFGEIEREALRTGSWDPIKKEIKSKVDPVVCSAKEIKHYTALAMVLLGEPETRGMLADFAKRFWDNTHPIEKARLVADLGSDAILTVLLAIFTAGLGAAANIAAKSNRLVKVAKLLEKVAQSLKRVKSFTRLPKKQKSPGLGKKKARAKDTLKGKGPQNPKSPKKGLDVDGNKKKSYKDSDVPKTTTKRNLKKEYSEIMEADGAKSIKKNLSKKGVKFSKKEKDNLKELFDDPEFQEMAPGADFEKAKRRIDGMSDEFTEKEIQDIKKYLFDNDEWAGPDPNNATAWKRIQKGEITEVEETLLKHERVERLLKEGLEDSGIKLEHRNAHFEAEQLYDFVSVADESPGFPFETP